MAHDFYIYGSVADPDPGSGIRCLFDPWIRDQGSGMGRKSASGSGIRDEQPGSYFPEPLNHFFGFFGVKILKFFDADPGSGMETVRIRDPGWKKVGSGIRDKHPGSATLIYGILLLLIQTHLQFFRTSHNLDLKREYKYNALQAKKVLV
jgi:hypothetical protein